MSTKPTVVDVEDVNQLVKAISALLAGQRPEVQGAALAELSSMFIAGHFRGGASLMAAVLKHHIDALAKLVPINALLLQKQMEKH
jgi:hypothetical protein